MHQFQNTGAAASTEIDFNDALFVQALQRSQMAGCNIHHVDVIPDTRSIRRIVVVSKYIQVWPSPTATWAMNGIKLFGSPLGSSPINPLSCAPTGLK